MRTELSLIHSITRGTLVGMKPLSERDENAWLIAFFRPFRIDCRNEATL